MRILVVTHNYPRWPGDRAGVFVARVAALARDRGHEVQVIAPHFPDALEAEVVDGIPVRRFRYASRRFERIGYQGDVRKSLAAPAALLAMPSYLRRFRTSVREAIRAFAPDVVHAHWWVPGGWAAAGQGVPLVISCHGSDVRLLLGSPLLRTMARRVLPRARRISVVSETMRNDIVEVIPSVADRVEVAYLPVDADRFSAAGTPRATPPRILFAGNLIAAKGVDIILRAYARLLRLGTDCELRLVGDGPGRPGFQRLAEELGIAGAVVWAGARPYEAMPEEFAAATVTVLASRGPRGEGLPLSLVEALLAGSAVVSTPAGGVGEIIQDGVTGLLAADGDDAGLARQLGRLLADGALRAGTVERGRALARTLFAPATAGARFEALYQAARAEGAR